MWISPAARVYLTTGVSLGAVAAATWTGMMARSSGVTSTSAAGTGRTVSSR